MEEPLLTSNNIYTVGSSLRYNSMIVKTVYDVLGIVPNFISTYNSRKFIHESLYNYNNKGKKFYSVDTQKGVIKNTCVGTS